MILVSIPLFSAHALAQVDAGALQQNLEKQLPSVSPLELPEPSRPTPAKPRAPSSGGVQVVVKTFVLEGVKALPEEVVQKVLDPWRNTPVSFDDLQKACDAIALLYREHGYVVQAILPPQKVADGTIKILITEAKLGAVIVDTPQGETRFSKETAAKYITYENPIGSTLNSRSLERAIIILNETPGVMASASLEPGGADGETAVRLQLTQPPLLNASIAANNYGSRTTGSNQGVIGFSLNNPSGIGDSVVVNGVYSEGSQYVQGSYSLPGSADGLRFGLSGSYLEYKNVSNYAAYGGTGDAWASGISAAYPLIRSQRANLNSTINYDVKSYNNRNTITNSTTSAYNLNNISVGLSGNMFDSLGYGAVSNASVNLVFGYLDFLAGTSTAALSAITPSSFTKANFSANRNQVLTEDNKTALVTSVSGQLASVNLSTAEQFYLGGPYGVRAYPVSQAGGSQGGLLSIELKRDLVEKLSVSTFFDAGVTQQYKNTYSGWQGTAPNTNNTYSLMGAGIGAKWSYESCNLGAMIAWKIGQQALVGIDGTSTNPRGWVTASCQM
ncbi:ShlB/FhaC/HecB family hemolysin secretion/activation protein [Polynucleobacter sp. Fuers-14]|uniref:ShlB/FhaC/HecB family hemolysin secretion/activation protein n=1 Tax=Polynucleobacter sp. Fuers-14 TaxID=1758364 RepID=UPI001C0DAF4F|nr:ShlB/FhaC/HecB family hemolysin secretion/activation protein [Polynucleobacter sp. Fuers-14]MBU3641734.1 ShlB/FhaC/HecB family hemolysin secretion/activation protein [Polynucleobacter sp. Fuers-14]